MRGYCVLFLVFFVLVTSTGNAVVNGLPLSSEHKPEVIRLNIERVHPINGSIEEACTGVAISHSLVLTAGHCLAASPQGSTDNVYFNRFSKEGSSLNIPSQHFFTQYIYEEFVDDRPHQLVPGCSLTPKKVTQTRTLDLGLVMFPDQTFDQWSDIDVQHEFQINDALEYYGYGSHVNTLGAFVPIQKASPSDLRFGANLIWRMNSQRISFLASLEDNFAAHGDSGGPVYKNNQVVAIMSTLEEHCETEFGSDYGVINTATPLSSKEALEFLLGAR